ncbi:hypothetical protein HFZ78_18785 [Priestia megaterium]|uniref:Uncharacterized protein n=1 Tax=Priestia megaterium TaxID=1404 RepID=A0A6H1P4I2_PRIMG|nr:hypothetical protein [Priestia megaterium]QIZ08500.1 hypothetical protein HFZ78_18785 [Priestia megaterium]
MLRNRLFSNLNINSFFEKEDRAHYSVIFSAVLLEKLNEAEQKNKPEQ